MSETFGGPVIPERQESGTAQNIMVLGEEARNVGRGHEQWH
jgi:hypothetical protein